LQADHLRNAVVKVRNFSRRANKNIVDEIAGGARAIHRGRRLGSCHIVAVCTDSIMAERAAFRKIEVIDDAYFVSAAELSARARDALG